MFSIRKLEERYAWIGFWALKDFFWLTASPLLGAVLTVSNRLYDIYTYIYHHMSTRGDRGRERERETDTEREREAQCCDLVASFRPMYIYCAGTWSLWKGSALWPC